MYRYLLIMKFLVIVIPTYCVIVNAIPLQQNPLSIYNVNSPLFYFTLCTCFYVHHHVKCTPSSQLYPLTGLGVRELSLRVMEEQSGMFEFKGNLDIQLVVLFLGEVIFPVTDFSYK